MLCNSLCGPRTKTFGDPCSGTFAAETSGGLPEHFVGIPVTGIQLKPEMLSTLHFLFFLPCGLQIFVPQCNANAKTFRFCYQARPCTLFSLLEWQISTLVSTTALRFCRCLLYAESVGPSSCARSCIFFWCIHT